MNEINVGDILAGTWGYSMVIPCFYKVIAKTEKRLRVVELPRRIVGSADGGYNQQCYEMPEQIDTIRIKSKQTQLARPWKDDRWLVGSKWDERMLTKWDGRPVYADYCD